MLVRCLPKLLLIAGLLPLFGCGVMSDTASIDHYNTFAIKAARAQLWNEAIFRWNQVLEIDPDNPKVHNNLGVAYEATGKIDEAIEAYKRATELDPSNKYYRFNYRKCRLHVQQNRRKLPASDPDDENVEPESEEEPDDEETDLIG